MHILITGSSGLVGSALIAVLTGEGCRISRLVRSDPGPGAARWDPEGGMLDPAVFEDVDAVVHLAGESVADGAWTPEKLARIRDSRVRSTQLLCATIKDLARPPGVLISASAVGYYGDRGEEVLKDDAPPGDDFLAKVCIDWEAATGPAAAAGVRVANPRFGIILSAAGGVLGTMLPLFKTGLGGRLGSGRQWLSWIAIDDVVGAIRHALETASLSGPFNCSAPNPVRNGDFAHALASVLGRPAWLPAPSFGLRLVFGERADALLLSSQRAQPARLTASGFTFRFPGLEPALRHVLGR